VRDSLNLSKEGKQWMLGTHARKRNTSSFDKKRGVAVLLFPSDPGIGRSPFRHVSPLKLHTRSCRNGVGILLKIRRD
jgi:hypothetical protein